MSARRKAKPRSYPDTDLTAGTCPDCGKRRYLSRAEARKAARRQPHRGRMNAYQCGGYWHIGHQRLDVRRGVVGREIYAQG